ncbi:elongation factor-like GTPase 1 [Lolium rigidum]|uniref:elongation factor-like GTPase 1 n=1 Tax=Lolium rigidum TaxID=89674 RepID=UPI001F5DB659|nr:elongation factor-like GTPase 1 [Lolium rigidum]
MVTAVAAAGDPRLVRNTCIMAHVDHGKTTLADHLVAYGSGGGLLTPKWAGQARVMDHLPEERARAITMKSAAVALRHGAHRVHLIDSPGHLDFCSEVSAAARLADSALILVDVVDGVHVQTHAALRKAFAERLRPCLVLNKLDRLITEMRLEPEEAYRRLRRIVAEANSVYSDLRSGSYFSSLLDGDGDEDAFAPQKGNVIFACARDGWGFRVHDFAALYAQAHPDMASKLLAGLWGPYCWDKKNRKVVGKDAMASQQPMFVEFVLKPLWKAYKEGLKEDGASWLRDQVVSRYNLKVSQRELQNKEPDKVLQAVLKAWLPLAETVMTMLVECTQDPIAAQRFRVPKLMPERELAPGDAAEHAGIVAEADKVRRCVTACSTSARAPVVVFVSKMFGLAYKDLPLSGLDGELLNHTTNGSDDECFLAFARVFSGVLRAGQKVFVLSPMYDPLKGDTTGKHLKEVELQHLYEMQGQDLRAVASVGAGNLVAIQGLGDHIMKTATLSSTRNCWPFASMLFQVSPLLKVAIEPSNLADLGTFVNGLRLLNQADPLAECTQENGQYLLAAAGKVHLELCIKNLNERFAKNVKLNVSEPLVSFKETIQGEGVGNMESRKGPQEFVERTAPDGKFAVRVKVIRLPDALTKVLEENEILLSQTIQGQTARSNGATGLQCSQDDARSVSKLRQHMLSAIDRELEAISMQVDKLKLERYRKILLGYLQRIWALGPSLVGPNLLLSPDVRSRSGAITSQDGREGILVCGTCHVSDKLGFVSVCDAETSNGIANSEPSTGAPDHETLRNIVVSGFQEATNAGPLCDEPMWGLAFIVEPFIFTHSPDNANRSYEHKAAVREACRAAVLQSKPRLVQSMYFCELTTPSVYLGAVYAVLGDCRAKVLKEEMQEGTSLFTVHAYLPVAESSEFSEKLRSATSGAASARLALSHWEAIPRDPFFVPKTKEEIEEFGDGSNMGPNLAKTLINSVRRRKGLHVEDKVVEHGTKQRTRAKKV